jgi:hypothetical protein
MKNVLMITLLVLASCGRISEKPLTPNLVETHSAAADFLALAKDKAMYLQLSKYLELSKITTVKGVQDVLIYMVKFKNDPNKVYAISTLGSELLYSNMMKDDRNGTIGIMKNGEGIAIEFKDGVKNIRDLSGNEFENRFANEYHGGSGFCQREKGESYGACYRAESDEFCDSFISCVALATQPSVAIIIGLACSCNA